MKAANHNVVVSSSKCNVDGQRKNLFRLSSIKDGFSIECIRAHRIGGI